MDSGCYLLEVELVDLLVPVMQAPLDHIAVIQHLQLSANTIYKGIRPR